MRPRLSIVCASGAGGEFLFKTLAALRDQVRRDDVELIVVDRVGGDRPGRIASAVPGAVVLAPEPGAGTSVPQLRALGFEAATGDVVAVIEEHTRPTGGWVQAILDNFRAGDAAIGGPILDDAYARRRDWVVYFSEYHEYMPPWPDADYYGLNGANIAYSREKVLRHRGVLGSGWWEAALHPLLAEEGRFRSIPAMGAHHMGPFQYGYYLRQRYLLSRVWGGTQRARVGLGARFAHLAAAPIFPLFLLARMARRALDCGPLFGEFARTVPLLVPAVCVYTWGEFLGYLVGPGTALERVE